MERGGVVVKMTEGGRAVNPNMTEDNNLLVTMYAIKIVTLLASHIKYFMKVTRTK